MALDDSILSSGIITELKILFADNENPPSDEDVWQMIAEKIVTHLITAGTVQVVIPAGAVIISVSGGSGTPAVGVSNPVNIPLIGDPVAGTGGIV